ncbi:ATP-binding protein [Nafulsella turpanensis]|uniref:ATP-binding protein n=1 Tax=Nafulsella turpanensis TaxID=1265690 RepID=UPI000347652C|nr:ATP-binding protein [Nafulsella turpanensis]
MQHNLADLLKQREGESLDFKQKISSCDKIAKTLCSFANTNGGIILVGVRDDRTVSGIDPEEEKFMLEQAALHFCQPPIKLQYEEVEDEDERTVLIVMVAQSMEKPHASLNKGGAWQVYTRLNDKSLPAGKHSIRQMEKQPLIPSAPHLNKNENAILSYLKEHEKITAKELAHLINFSRRRAERLLTDMSGRGLIRLFEHEQENYYA